MKLATTTGDFSAYTTSQAEAIAYIGEAGFSFADYNFCVDSDRHDGVYLADWRAYADDIKRQTDVCGVQLVQAHAPMGAPIAENNAAFIADTARCIEACAIWGIPNLVVHTGYAPGLSVEETFVRNKAFFTPLLQVAETCGINILVENFNKMCIDGLYWIDNANDLLALIEYIDHPLLHAVWDAGHGNLQEMPQHEQLKVLGEHVYALHVQDNMGDTDSHLPPFCGTLNLDSLMYGLTEIGYKGYFTFEAGSRFQSAAKRRVYADDTRLAQPSLALRKAEERLLYETGKYILSAYDCFEE